MLPPLLKSYESLASRKDPDFRQPSYLFSLHPYCACACVCMVSSAWACDPPAPWPVTPPAPRRAVVYPPRDSSHAAETRGRPQRGRRRLAWRRPQRVRLLDPPHVLRDPGRWRVGQSVPEQRLVNPYAPATSYQLPKIEFSSNAPPPKIRNHNVPNDLLVWKLVEPRLQVAANGIFFSIRRINWTGLRGASSLFAPHTQYTDTIAVGCISIWGLRCVFEAASVKFRSRSCSMDQGQCEEII